MPIVKFQCHHCGFRFSKRVNLGMNETPCQNCKDPAISLEAKVSIGYDAKIDGVVRPQASGIESLDTDIERIVAKDSADKWETIYQRRQDKWDIVNETGEHGKHILVAPNGEYFMNKEDSVNLKNIKNDARNQMGINYQQET
ncbi:hypothetical protein EB001_09855 [bacterium]|nr:hypothetical protein [bacterium]